MKNILNKLSQVDKILATIPVKQDAVFAMASARHMLGEVAAKVAAAAEKEAKPDGNS